MLLATIAMIGIGNSNVAIYGFSRGLTESRSGLTAAADEAVSIFGRDESGSLGAVSYEQYQLLRGQTNAFEWIGAARISRRTVSHQWPFHDRDP